MRKGLYHSPIPRGGFMTVTGVITANEVLKIAWDFLQIDEKAEACGLSAKRRIACRKCVKDFEKSFSQFNRAFSILEDEDLKNDLTISFIKKLDSFEKQLQEILRG